MPDTNYADAALKHRIPVIDRMMDVLSQLERRESGLTIRDLVTQLHLPRTTIYRILNTLQMHDMVHRDEGGAYQLGRRLLGLAAHVATGASEVDLVAVAQPYLDKLAADLGEGVKLSVLDKNGVLVLAAAQGRREYALTVAPGLITAGAPEISDLHARSLRDGLRSLQLAFREASVVPDPIGQGPGEKWTGAVT